MDHNTIGVLLPVYKNDKCEYLSLSIDSILKQTYANLILYIGIDGPISEELKNIISCYLSDYRIRVNYFKENRGLAVVLNDLLRIAIEDNIEFIARMDADDISVLDRFSKQLDFLKSHSEIDVVGGSIFEIDEDGLPRNKTIIYPPSPKECLKFFAKRNPHAHPAVMFRKRFFEKIGHAYRPEYRQNQDTLLWFDGFIKGTQNANIPDIVLNFRMTESLIKKRRNGWDFAQKQFKDRIMINRTLNYGIVSYIFCVAMFILQLSPTSIRKVAYKIFR